MKLLKTLGNPFALVAEGFLAGALVFAAINPGLLHSESNRTSAESAALVRQLTR